MAEAPRPAEGAGGAADLPEQGAGTAPSAGTEPRTEIGNAPGAGTQPRTETDFDPDTGMATDRGAGTEPPVPAMLLRIHQLRWIALLGLSGAAVMIGLAFVSGRFERTVAELRRSAHAPPGDPGADSLLHAPAPTFSPVPGITAAATAATARSDPQLPAVPTPLAVAATPRIPANRVGLIPGHWQYDTGTVCADGLREVDVTLDVAQRVKAILAARGFAVDLVPEHDPRRPQPPLQNYRGAVLVSIHVDSCSFPGLSGFKTARWRHSDMPATDDRLVACLNRAYAAATGLPRHDNTINANMWNYYAFREIAAETPAAIIELAFLRDDRAFVDAHRYEMALGVADGIGCFLAGP